MKQNIKLMAMTAILSSTLVLSGCGAMSTAIKKRNLEVKTQMSETIWLETVLAENRISSDKEYLRQRHVRSAGESD